MAKSSTSIKPGEKRNPSGRPPLTESERQARDLLSTATPGAVKRLIQEIEQDGPMAVKCAMFIIEHRLGKAPAAEEDREAMRLVTLGVEEKKDLFALARGEIPSEHASEPVEGG